MAIYTPNQLSPEFEVFDATANKTFTWLYNGSSAQYGFRLYIRSLPLGILVHDSGLQTSSTQSYTLPLSTLSNNNSYYWILRAYENISTYSDSESIFFQTAQAPVVTMSIAATPTDYTLTVLADYTLSTGTTIQKYKFILYDSSENTVEDSGYQYGYNTNYTFTGLISGTTYKAECIIIDQNNQTGTSGKVQFTPSYTSENAVQYMDITAIDTDGYIQVAWDRFKQLLAVATGNYSYVAGKFGQAIYIEDNTSYVTITEDLGIDSTITLWIKLDAGFIGDIVHFNDGDYTIFYDGERFGFSIGDYITCGGTTEIYDQFFLMGIKYGTLIIKTDSYEEILY